MSGLPSPVGVWLRNDAALAVRGGGTGERMRDGERLGDADTGVGIASVGIDDGGGRGGIAGAGVRVREGVEVGTAGERERTGVDAGVWIGVCVFSGCERKGGGREGSLGFSTSRLSSKKRKSMPYSSRSFTTCWPGDWR